VTTCSRVGRSRHRGGHTAVTIVAANATTAWRQLSVATTAMTPSAADPEGVIAAAHTLLHNSPGPEASPEPVEQCRNDIDHLIIAVVNTPLHRRQQRARHSRGSSNSTLALLHTPKVVRAPSAGCTPTSGHIVASLAPTDLSAELECHYSLEDGRTTVEHQCEKHRNLDGDYGTPAVVAAGLATHSPSCP
jgi:hypothetical protein